MGKKEETEGTKNIICPYCFHEHINSFEYDLWEDYTNIECENCRKNFLCWIEIEITFFSKKIK